MGIIIFSLLLAAAVAHEAFHSKNHVDNIPKEFWAALNKYLGQNYFMDLLKREYSQEIQERMANFRAATIVVEDINDNPNSLYSAQINEIAVMTDAEKKAMRNLNATLLHQLSTQEKRDVHLESKNSPMALDWVKRGGQPAPKHQGSCGSCYLFAAVSAIEGRYFALTGQLVSFSEQELLDCTLEVKYTKNKRMDYIAKLARNAGSPQLTTGCKGGFAEYAYSYVTEFDRLALMKDFPYQGIDRTCNMSGIDSGLTKAILTTTQHIATPSDSALQSAVVEGVVAVAIKTVDQFDYYAGGIFTCFGGCDCAGEINHDVSVVGYAPNYWRVRNSWGSHWGEAGYIKMSRMQNNICMIQTYIQIPVLECRPGHTCDKYDGSEGDDEWDKDEIFDYMGVEVQCGIIQHFGGLCVGFEQKSGKNYAVTASAGCSRQFCLTRKGQIVDKASRKCLTVTNPKLDGAQVLLGECRYAHTWKKTKVGLKIQSWWTKNKYGRKVKASSGKCWHPFGGSPNPPEDNKIVIHSGCDEERLAFQIEKPLCWEETSGQLLRIPMALAFVRDHLEKAKDLCVATKACKGVYLKTSGSVEFEWVGYYLYSTDPDQGRRSIVSTDKNFTMKECEETCDAGTQRCEDGECKQKCSEEDEDCPAETSLCHDGTCKHIHLCGPPF